MSNIDFMLDEDGDIVLNGNDIVFSESVEQSIETKLKWVLGEYRYRPSVGIDYVDSVFAKDTTKDSVEYIMREAIASVDGVASVEEVVVYVENRVATIYYSARLVDNSYARRKIIVRIGG